MTAALSPTPKLQFFDANGNPLVGGKVYSYAAGTTTPLATYTDATGTTPAANPIILNGRGETSLWLGDAAYKLKLTTAADVDVWTVDNVEQGAAGLPYTPAGTSLLNGVVTTAGDALNAITNTSTGSQYVGFLQAGLGAVTRTAQAKMRDIVSVKDFGAVGDGVTDDTAAIQAAVNYCLTFDPPAVLTVSGLCRLDSSVNIDRGVDATNASTYFIIKGDGIGGGFYAYIGVTMFSTTLPTSDPVGLVASQKIHFDNIVFKSEFPSNPTYVLDDAKFLRMKFTNCSFHRIKLLNATRYLQSYYLNNCMAYGWLGTFFNGTNGAYDIKIDNFVAEAGAAFYSVICNDVYSGDPNAQISVTNSLFQSITGAAIQADRAQGFVIENCYFEGNGSNGAPDIKFDTARNLANLTPNGSIKVTGCFFSQKLANFNDPNYWSVRWGRVNNGFATANYLVNLGTGASLKLHYTQAESRVVFMGEPGYIQGHFSEFVAPVGGYVMPGTGGERIKLVRGTVSSAGTISAGSGFTVTKIGTGQYQIDMQTAFSANPSAVATAVDFTGQNVAALANVANTATINVAFRDVTHAFIDTSFNFVIVGPA
jgi:hypothetical protein